MGLLAQESPTLLRCINLMEIPTSGRVIIDGECINEGKVKIAKVRKKVGMVFQHFNLFPHMTTLKNVAYAPIKVKGIKPKVAKERKRSSCWKRVGLGDKADAYPSNLSRVVKSNVRP